MNRRDFTLASMGLATAWATAAPAATQSANAGSAFAPFRSRPVSIAMLVFERMDQIDFTGPFSVLSRLPDSTLQVVGLGASPIRDHKGLVLTPQADLAAAKEADVLVIPGGPGQEALMHQPELLAAIASQVESGRVLFSVCTGALLCGAAGVLRGRCATTHWASMEFLRYFGAEAVRQRVVVDERMVSAAGITAGIDGALTLAALLRGDEVAERIQLDIQYAPDPPFHSGDPLTAPKDVLDAVRAGYRSISDARLKTAMAYAEQSLPRSSR